jgi:Tetratricopeptide repeat
VAAYGRLRNYLGYSGSYPAAWDLFQVIANAHRDDDAYGAEHRDTLNARASLAYWAGKAGDPAAARDQFAALLPVRERVSGPEHPDTLIARANLAYWTGKAERGPEGVE